LELKLECIGNPVFEQPTPVEEAEMLAEIRWPTESPELDPRKRALSAPPDASPYLASLYETRLLTPLEECQLFRKLNFLRYRALRLRDELVGQRLREAKVVELEQLLSEAEEVRNQIIRANLRLVVSIAKTYVDETCNFHDLVSDGNVSLMRAVDKFDFARGFRFSTYATWAIRKNFNRAIAKLRAERKRYVAGEAILDITPDCRGESKEREQNQLRLRSVVARILNRLEGREQSILAARFGLRDVGAPSTLAAIGDELGISKERVRQLEARALEKLRGLAMSAGISLGEA